MYHNGPNHPAKYGCLGFRSRKVSFRLVNRVSLIFNPGTAGTLTRDQIVGSRTVVSVGAGTLLMWRTVTCDGPDVCNKVILVIFN